MDAFLNVLCYIIKLYRLSVLWIVMYVVEKVYQGQHIMRVYVEDKKPKPLSSYIVLCMFLESVAFFLLFFALFMVMLRYKHPKNTFVIDRVLLTALLVDYVLTTLFIVGVGTVVCSVAQDRQLFRYQHDGLRGIRACASVLFVVSIVALLLPFYLIA